MPTMAAMAASRGFGGVGLACMASGPGLDLSRENISDCRR
jgi:hypothetical protein